MEQNKNVSASENSKVLAGRHVYVSHLCLRLLACLLACLLANINNNMSKFFELFFLYKCKNTKIYSNTVVSFQFIAVR